MSRTTADNNDQTWLGLCLGREQELADLQRHWQKTKAGEPQMVVLLADTGFGKTRLVQEFYNWLSQHEDGIDPQGYWPDRLNVAERSLSINATPKESTDPMPWLWWGIRFTNPHFRNQPNTAGYGLYAALPDLEPHLQSVETRLGRVQLAMETGLAALSAALGPLGSLVDVIGLVIRGLDAKKEENLSPAEARQAQSDKLEKRLADGLGALLHASVTNKILGIDRLPVILVVDDAQWADPLTCRFLQRLFSDAREHGWPLMILATHWQREWQETLDGGAETNFAKTCLGVVGKDWAPYPLKRLGTTPMGEILRIALPGLSEQHRDKLLRRAGGCMRCQGRNNSPCWITTWARTRKEKRKTTPTPCTPWPAHS